MFGKIVHTWHGNLYCGTVSLETLQGLDGKNGKDVLAGIDPDGHLLAHGVYHYMDFEGYAVTLRLEGQ